MAVLQGCLASVHTGKAEAEILIIISGKEYTICRNKVPYTKQSVYDVVRSGLLDGKHLDNAACMLISATAGTRRAE